MRNSPSSRVTTKTITLPWNVHLFRIVVPTADDGQLLIATYQRAIATDQGNVARASFVGHANADVWRQREPRSLAMAIFVGNCRTAWFCEHRRRSCWLRKCLSGRLRCRTSYQFLLGRLRTSQRATSRTITVSPRPLAIAAINHQSSSTQWLVW
jgi:hypothetical protein